MTVPCLVDERGESHWLYRVAGIPTTILIDKEGKIAARLVGYSSGSEDFLRAALKKVGIE
jgi:thioredoxin-related protein